MAVPAAKLIRHAVDIRHDILTRIDGRFLASPIVVDERRREFSVAAARAQSGMFRVRNMRGDGFDVGHGQACAAPERLTGQAPSCALCGGGCQLAVPCARRMLFAQMNNTATTINTLGTPGRKAMRPIRSG